MQGTLTTSSLLSVTGTEVTKTDTNFLEVLDSSSKNGTFSGNCSISRRLSRPLTSSRQPQRHWRYPQLPGYCFSGPPSSFSSQDTPFFYLYGRFFRSQ